MYNSLDLSEGGACAAHELWVCSIGQQSLETAVVKKCCDEGKFAGLGFNTSNYLHAREIIVERCWRARSNEWQSESNEKLHDCNDTAKPKKIGSFGYKTREKSAELIIDK